MSCKLIIIFVIFVSLIFAIIPKSYAFSDLDSICLYIAENDKKRLRKALKTSHVKIRKLYQDMRCNDKSLLQFAIERKAKEVGLFMVKKIPVSLLKKKGALEWAESNGHADSDITVALKKRVGG
jgi:hypothetical protein